MLLRRLRTQLRFELSDSFSFAFLITSVISVFSFEVFVVLPALEEGLIPHLVHLTLGTFIFINILSNLAMTMLRDSSIRKIVLPVLLKPGWHFCPVCEANAPPRSFHCSVCKVCILKRDHHCTFACVCVGLKNFRFYFLFLLYLSIGATYATVFNMYFIWDVLGGFSLYSLAVHLVPFIFMILGFLSLRVFLCTFLSLLSVTGAVFVTNLFVFHLRQMLSNQTTFERNCNIKVYDLGWKKNVAESLGINWQFGWIFPLISSPLPSDGLTFEKNNMAEAEVYAVLHSNQNENLVTHRTDNNKTPILQ